MKNIDNINMEGILVNDELIKVLRNYKQGSILESSYLQVQHTISKDMVENLSHLDIKEISKKEMIQKLSTEIVDKYKNSFEETEVQWPDNGIKLTLSIITMSPSELKHIVEYCVRTMPMDAIEEIRK
jgi:hypothetical protein